MANTTTSHPSMSQIGTAQNEETSLRRQLAAGHFYRWAKRLHFGGASLTIVLALISPVVLWFIPDVGPLLGAAAGVWLFASRLVLVPLKRDFQLKGATAQQLFDCAIFRLDWNDALARRLSEEEIRGASGSMKGAETVRDWYPTDTEMGWPRSILVCQRSNAVWARRQHRAYAYVLRGAAASWFVIGVVVALVDGARLADYLVTIALPSLPALLDATELARAHVADADKRQLLEIRSDELLCAESATDQELREIQDQLFDLRRAAPLVPAWFYNRVRPNFEEDMRYAAQRVANGDSSTQTRSG